MSKSKGMVIGALVILCAICLGGVFWNSTKNQKLPGESKKVSETTQEETKLDKIIYESEDDLTIETLSSIEEMPLSETEEFSGVGVSDGTTENSPENSSGSTSEDDNSTVEDEHTHENTANSNGITDRTEGSTESFTEVSDEPEAGHTHEDTAEASSDASVPLDTIIPMADGSTVLYFSTAETTPEGRVEDMKQVINDLSAICYYPTEITYFGQFKEGYVYQIFLKADIEAAK